MDNDIRFYRCGDGALTVQFGQSIEPRVSDRVLQLDKALRARPVPGVYETVPTYCSLLVLFDKTAVSYEALCRSLQALAAQPVTEADTAVRCWQIPCCYGRHFGPDIQNLCAHTGLSAEEIIRRHSAAEYRIYMLGFLPGFVYLGGLDPQLAAPRLAEPRLEIPRGAVGIGGAQTGVYPIKSPGGWQLIGNTPLDMYDPRRQQPVLCSAGDHIRFVPIGLMEYYDIRRAVIGGTYTPEYMLTGRGGDA